MQSAYSCFNSRTREGCDLRALGTRASARYSFNSRTREGCDSRVSLICLDMVLFQFTHPGGVRPPFSVRAVVITSVSIHAPGRGATYVYGYAYRYFKVSIHAPGRGATSTNSNDNNNGAVSIHAPGRGATIVGIIARHLHICFNSRTREGCDTERLQFGDSEVSVSIHAPGRGATGKWVNIPLSMVVSIHAPGRGATVFDRSPQGRLLRFNSRTREGCDMYERERDELLKRFNSRTREGCDPLRLSVDTSLGVFQFTHPGGVRRRTQPHIDVEVRVSIHAPGRGATQLH